MKLTIDTTDHGSLKQALRDGITTPALLAEWIDDDDQAIVENDCLILNPGEWEADDGNAQVTITAVSAEEAAEIYVADGEWGTIESTTWITVCVWRDGLDASGEDVQVDKESHTITLEPDEPNCIDSDDHDWDSPYDIVGGCKENPGCWGHGGGVVTQSVCMRCGCGRTIDGWAQNPANGEQGLTSVSYEPGKYDVEAAEA